MGLAEEPFAVVEEVAALKLVASWTFASQIGSFAEPCKECRIVEQTQLGFS